jgi:hypothetical protein
MNILLTYPRHRRVVVVVVVVTATAAVSNAQALGGITFAF